MERNAAGLSWWRHPLSARSTARPALLPATPSASASTAEQAVARLDPAVARLDPTADIAQSEIRGAIALVGSGAALRVVVCGIGPAEPAVSALTAIAADAGVLLEIEVTEDGCRDVVVRRR
jgi:hypothetical protein